MGIPAVLGGYLLNQGFHTLGFLCGEVAEAGAAGLFQVGGIWEERL